MPGAGESSYQRRNRFSPLDTSATLPIAKASGVGMYSANFENYLPTSKVLSPVFYLRFNMTGAEEYANSTTEPSNPLFHHFLSPNELKQKFGPSESELSLVESWLSGNGINDYARYGAFGLTFNATVGTTSSMLGTRLPITALTEMPSSGTPPQSHFRLEFPASCKQ